MNKLLSLLSVVAFAAVSATAAIDINAISINPMFLKPGKALDVVFTMNKTFESADLASVYSVKIAAMFSRDSIWNNADDLLFAYSGGSAQGPIAYDDTKNTWELTGPNLYNGWADYHYPTVTPASFLHGEKWYIIVKIGEGSPWYDVNKSIASMSSSWERTFIAPFEVAVNKDAVYNTAYANEKSATATLILSAGLPPANIIATPSSGIGSVYTFNTKSLSVALATTKAPGATIYYSLDGSVPSAATSSIYDSMAPLTISGSDTLRALAVVPGYENATGIWYYQQVFSPAFITATPGVLNGTHTYTSVSLPVVIATNPGNRIHYVLTDTLTNTIVDSATVTTATGSHTVSIAGDIRLSAWAEGDTLGRVSGIWSYHRNLPLALLTATPGDTQFSTVSLRVHLNTDPGNHIHYTVDGSAVDTLSSPLVPADGWITITGDTHLRALAQGPGYIPTVGDWTYDCELPQLNLRATPGDSTHFTFNTSVALAALDGMTVVSAARIYYLIDSTGVGTAVDSTNGLLYTGIMTIDTTVTVRAVAYADGYVRAIGSWLYILDPVATVLTADPASTDTIWYGDSISVTLTSNADSIRYTLDGTAARSGTVYAGSAIVGRGDILSINATAYGHGYTPVVKTFVYARKYLSVLVADPASSAFDAPFTVTLRLRDSWSGVRIFYTLDGSVPDSTNGMLYTGGISIATSTVLKAIAYADNAIQSPVLTEIYTQRTAGDAAWYYDHSGDGAIDAAAIHLTRVSGVLPDTLVLINPFDSTDVRRIAKSSLSFAGNDSMSAIVEASLATPFAFGGRTTFTIGSYGRFVGTRYASGGFAIGDSVAPVINRAILAPGIIDDDGLQQPDTLTVVFSEAVQSISGSTPFESIQKNGTLYHFVLGSRTQNDSTVVFLVTSLDAIDRALNGDSLWIAVPGEVSDLSGTLQTVTDNRRVPLTVLVNAWRLKIMALSPFIPKTSIIPAELTPLNFSFDKGLVIEASFHADLTPYEDEIDASFDIVDALGNIVANCSGKSDPSQQCGVDIRLRKTGTSLLMYWNGCNENSRTVNAGIFIVHMRIRVPGSEVREEKISVGVRQ